MLLSPHRLRKSRFTWLVAGLLLAALACNLPTNQPDGTPSGTAPPDEGESGPTAAPGDDSTQPPADQPVAEETRLPLAAILTPDGSAILLVDPETGETARRIEDPPPIFNRDYARQVALDGEAFFGLASVEGAPAQVYQAGPEGVSPLDMAAASEDQTQAQAVAVWPGTETQPPRIAWSAVTFAPDETLSAIRVGPLEGSGEIETVAEITSEQGRSLIPLRWSLDGQRLYYSEEPGGFGAVGANYFGFSNLSYFDFTARRTVTLIPDTLFEFTTCLDDLAADERFVAHHCAGIGLLDLEHGLLNVAVFAPDVGEGSPITGSVRLNPSGTRLAFAIARGDLQNEQGWLAVTDDLSGRSRLLATGGPGFFLNVAGWLDDSTVLVDQLPGTLNESLAPSVWLATVDGEWRKLADGNVVAILNPQASDTPGQPPQVAGVEGTPSGEGTEQPPDVPTPTLPIPTEPDPPEVGTLIYETDFRVIWPELEQDNGSATPRADGYLLDVTEFYLYTFTTQARQSAFYAEVTATPQTCPVGSGAYGLMFHFESETRFRYAVATCAGRFGLFERTATNEVAQLAEGRLPDAVTPGSGAHRIGVLAENNSLTIYVDDYPLASVTVTAMPSGDIGPYVETTDVPISILYTRMAIFEP